MPQQFVADFLWRNALDHFFLGQTSSLANEHPRVIHVWFNVEAGSVVCFLIGGRSQLQILNLLNKPQVKRGGKTRTLASMASQ